MKTDPPPGPEVAQAFQAAMADYASVLQGQAVLVADLCDTVTVTWIRGSAALLSEVDALRAALPPAALGPEVEGLLSGMAARLTAQMAEVQRQDAVRQLLDSLSRMAEGLRLLDLAQMAASVEGAEAPRRILAGVAADYVSEEQRAVLGAAIGSGGPDRTAAPDIELF